AQKRSNQNMIPYEQAKAQGALDWNGYVPPKPTFTGIKVFDDYPLEKLVETIDWTPFFMTWELAGKYPNILQDKMVGEAATELFKHAQELLADIVKNKKLKAQGVIGFWPANQVNHDDIELAISEKEKVILHHVRQQDKKGTDKNLTSLADF